MSATLLNHFGSYDGKVSVWPLQSGEPPQVIWWNMKAYIFYAQINGELFYKLTTSQQS